MSVFGRKGPTKRVSIEHIMELPLQKDMPYMPSLVHCRVKGDPLSHFILYKKYNKYGNLFIGYLEKNGKMKI